MVKYFSLLFGEIVFFLKAFSKHSVLLLMKEKCEKNVLEAVAILPTNALERRGLRYCVSFQLAQY